MNMNTPSTKVSIEENITCEITLMCHCDLLFGVEFFFLLPVQSYSFEIADESLSHQVSFPPHCKGKNRKELGEHNEEQQ
jgi:hypothetical protein